MTIYRYRVDLRCHLSNGDTDVLRRYRVRVEAYTEREARRMIPDIATEKVHDEGGDLLDAPLDYLEVIHIEGGEED